MKEIGVYVHIPFCIKRCSYCDFISFSDKKDKIEKYITVLKQEITDAQEGPCMIRTIYIGGGTPSYIDSRHIKDVLDVLRSKWEVDKNAEITLEINPRNY